MFWEDSHTSSGKTYKRNLGTLTASHRRIARPRLHGLGRRGIGGFFERMFAPRTLGATYADELKRLDLYPREQGSGQLRTVPRGIRSSY
jgi:hypothetical protein